MPADPPRPLVVPASHSSGTPVGPDLRALVRLDAVHRDAYLSPAVFRLEMTRLWARTWIFAGHESQIPAPGDYVTVDLATQPCILVRHGDGSVRVLRNRCAHKGAKVVSDASGNTGAFFRCPYHAWAYDTDGTVRAIPRRQGYDGTRLHDCPAGAGLAPAAAVESYRGFVFARLTGDGPTLSEHLGPMREVIDNMLDRSPSGEIAVAGGCLRTVVRANWKIYLENINDTMHAVTAHESASSAAERVWARQPADRARPLSMQQLLPFGSGYAFFEQMGGRTLPNGHTLLGTAHSLHSAYASTPEYVAALEATAWRRRARCSRSRPRTPWCIPDFPSRPRRWRCACCARSASTARSSRRGASVPPARPTNCWHAVPSTTAWCSRHSRWSRTTTCTSSRRSTRACARARTRG